MSTVVKAKCPQCKTPVSVEDERTAEPVTCPGCQATFIPEEAIAADNKRFEIMLYVGMVVVAIGLLVYGAMTGQLKPPQPQGADPPAVEQAADE
jgi:pyruvate/2-oxoacid:ferredoxin oxidoreductase beta subunit